MAILHGTWLGSIPAPTHPNATAFDTQTSHPGNFFIWGETWRSQATVSLEPTEPILPSYPYAMNAANLAEFLETLDQKGQLHLPESAWKPNSIDYSSHILALPAILGASHTLQASYSASPVSGDLALYPWQVTGIVLEPTIAVSFLAALPLWTHPAADHFIAGDLQFWSHVNRWSADLLVRSKFLPTLTAGAENCWQVNWQPLLDSAIDRNRFKVFGQQMPDVCRTAQQSEEPNPAQVLDAPRGIAVELPLEPGAILRDFLQQVMAVQIRGAVRKAIDSEWTASAAKGGVDAIAIQWLNSLGSPASTLTDSDPAVAKLATALQSWTTPLHHSLWQQNAWRVCFRLQPPASRNQPWQLEFFLQSVDEPELLVSAETIWSTPSEQLPVQGRTIERPQETFLMGLGLASRVYSPIESSLQAARPTNCHLNPSQVYEFLKATAWRLEDSGFGVILPESLANREGWANRLGLKIRAQAPELRGGLGLNSLLNFKWELAIGGQTLSKAEFDRLVALNTPLVEINGEWVELRPQDIKAAQTFFANRKNQTGLSLEDALRLSTGDTITLEKLPVVSFEASGTLEELLSTLTGNHSIESIANPPGFKGELRPYQARGVGWLAFLERWNLGACLADDMGLGKTIQLLAFLLHLQAEAKLQGPSLLICPTSVLGNWEREVKRFAPQLKTLIHHGGGRTQGKGFAKMVQEKDLVITSYPLVYRDETVLGSITWRNLVLDEAQNIKNPDARQSKAVRQLQAQFRIALTGTPLENRLSELWSILDFLNPGYLGPRNFFQRRFATPIERYGDTASLKTLRSLVQPFILRRLKTDRDIIQDLPEKQEMTVFCGLTAEQAALYEQVVQRSLQDIESAEGIQRRGLILATLTKLKQICNHPAQFLKERNFTAATAALKDDRSGKLKRLEEMLEEAVAEGDRALIFTQFAEMGKLLQSYLRQQLGWETLFLYGSTPKAQREAMIDRFQHDPQGPRIFILSLKAGGVGLNLTRANHVFHFDRWWNPAVENQATDRVFRIGQQRNVQVHKYVCTGTLEEKIHEQIESKKALAEQVVGAGENWLTELDTDQLRNLLLLDRTAVIDEEG